MARYIRTRKKGFSFLDFLGKTLTNWIIFLNVIIYLGIMICSWIFGDEKILSLIALQANGVFSGKVWTLLTSMFSHFHLWHLLANIFSLYFIGNFVERLIGKKRMFWFYLIAGLFAGIFYSVLAYYFGDSALGLRLFGSPETFAVGASGAVFGLLGLLAVLIPRYPVYLIAGPIIALIADSILSVFFGSYGFYSLISTIITIYIFVAVFSIMSPPNSILRKISIPIKMKLWVAPIIALVPLILIGLIVDLPIGNTAHLGGLIIGIIYGLYIKYKYKKKASLIVDYFSEE